MHSCLRNSLAPSGCCLLVVLVADGLQGLPHRRDRGLFLVGHPLIGWKGPHPYICSKPIGTGCLLEHDWKLA